MQEINVLGIDIGSSCVKVFAGKIQSDGGICITGNGVMPAVGFIKGSITDAEALAQSVKEAVECVSVVADTVTENIFLGLGGMGIQSIEGRGAIAPKLPGNISSMDIERVKLAAIAANVADELHVLHIVPKRFLVDNQEVNTPIGCKGERLEIEAHITALPKAELAKLTTALEKKGIVAKEVLANGVVGSKALLPNTNDGQACLVMEMGAGVTDLTILRDNHAFQIASLPLGGDYITRDIMQGVGIKVAHAEEIKRYYDSLDKGLYGKGINLDCNDYGTSDKNISYDFLADIVESRIEEIVSLIYDFVKPSLENFGVKTITLTGGCAAMNSIRTSIEKKFGMSVESCMPSQLPSEYAWYANTACYGIMCHAAKVGVVERPIDQNIWQALKHRVKSFFD
ncbi:MAG: cell division protein FtsA [Pelosinus sp.]|nr:cell division protein FtsA [Pelosinus sp.]